MTDYSTWKILKSELNKKQEEYSAVAEWCNESEEYHIEEQGDFYAVSYNVAPTEDELKSRVREVRNHYLQEYDFTQLPDAPFTAEAKELYAGYRQYLRDYTNGENWWLQNPKTFEEWSA